MRLKNCTFIFGVILYADKPWVRINFNNLCQACFWIDACGFEAIFG